MFLWIVGKILFSLFPTNMKMFLSKSITKPKKAHVHSFGYEFYNNFSDDAVGENVVKLNWCWTLDMDHFMYGITNWNSIFAVYKT